VRVIGVIDLRHGRAVRAYAGRRDRYQPIGDAVDLARQYVDRYKLTELYVADLDAIESAEQPAQQIRQIADLGVPLWLDAGVSSVERARHALDLGATRVIVGLETLPSFYALRSICTAIGGGLVAFSLDLRAGEPIAGRGIPHEAPEQLVARAADAGARSVIVLDLARVGTRAGVDFELLGRIRKAAPGLALLAGGGVRGPADVEKLAALGCDGALVATALDALYPSVTR
jgi:phosphoribosylformimino-5-aminoimidazole carboxamide ribotide isomerase